VSRISSITIRLSEAQPNGWNPNVMNAAMYRKELASLRKFGYVNPILVRHKGKGYEIIDGEHRWRALHELGYEEAEVTVIEGLSDAEAKQLTIVLNETRGRPQPEKLGRLLADLLGTETKSDLLDLLPIAPPEFDRLAGLEGFDWSALGKDPEPVGDTRSWVERTYRLPRDAAAVIDDAIERVRDGDEGVAEWQALEAIAADFLAGAPTSATPHPLPMDRASTAGSR
jgi:ParB-like chromosome segregation protein Spo0J